MRPIAHTAVAPMRTLVVALVLLVVGVIGASTADGAAPVNVPAPYLTLVTHNGSAVLPASLAPFIQLNTALFGQHLGSGGATGPLLIPTDENGCSAADPLSAGFGSQPRLPLRDAIVLISNGGACNAVTKAINMQTLGVKAVVVYHCSVADGCNTARQWSASSDLRPTIPYVIMENQYGEQLSAAIRAGNEVVVTLPGSGPMHPEDRAAMLDLYTALGGLKAATRWSFYNRDRLEDPNVSDKSGGLASWDMLAETNTDPARDPCVDRLYGVTCVEGRVVQIQCAKCGIPAAFALPPAIGRLRNLTYLNFNTNNLVGPMPAEIGDLAQLEWLDLAGNQITSLAPALGRINGGSLKRVLLSGNAMTGAVPAEVRALSSVQIFDVSNNRLSSLGGSVSAMSGLTRFLANGNQLQGEVPAFSGLADLAAVDLSNNQFSTVHATGFANCPQLSTLSLARNQISGPIPAMSGLPVLVSVDLSYNAMSGPPSLACVANGDLGALETLSLQHNAFTSPFTWSNCLKLTTVDASYNRLTSASHSQPLATEPQAGKFLADVLPPFVVSVDFSRNQLGGGWPQGLFGKLLSLKKLLLAHNAITNLPLDLFSSGKYASIELLDVSSNALEGAMPLGTPGASLHAWKLADNPALVATTNLNDTMLPSYFVPTASKVASPAGDYACKGIEGPLDLAVTLSPSFYAFKYCDCSLGFYGHPPTCTPFPTDVSYNDSSIATISDGAASGRIRKGLDTYYFISPRYAANSSALASSSSGSRRLLTGGNGAPADVVSYLLEFEHFDLSDANRDRLMIYSGIGTDALPMHTFSQRNPAPARLHVVAQALTIYFTSWSSSGLHFSLKYTALNFYPEGYLPTEWQMPSALHAVAIALIAISGVAFVALLCYLITKRDSRLMIASSPLFVYLTVCGALLLLVAAITFVLPVGDGVCMARQWLSPLAFALILSPLLVKTQRLNKIFNLKVLRASRAITNNDLLLSMAGLASPLLLTLIITSAMGGERSVATAEPAPKLGNYYLVECSEPRALMYSSFAYLLALSLWGSWLSYRVRNVPSAFNEASQIMNTIVALLMYGVIIFPLQLLIGSDQPAAVFVLRCIGYVLAAWLSMGCLYVPKLLILLGKAAAGADRPALQTKMNDDDEEEDEEHAPTPDHHMHKGGEGGGGGGAGAERGTAGTAYKVKTSGPSNSPGVSIKERVSPATPQQASPNTKPMMLTPTVSGRRPPVPLLELVGPTGSPAARALADLLTQHFARHPHLLPAAAAALHLSVGGPARIPAGVFRSAPGTPKSKSTVAPSPSIGAVGLVATVTGTGTGGLSPAEQTRLIHRMALRLSGEADRDVQASPAQPFVQQSTEVSRPSPNDFELAETVAELPGGLPGACAVDEEDEQDKGEQ